LVLHLLGRLLAALHHALCVHADLLHLTEQRHRVLVLVQRVVRALHRLVFSTLADQPAELFRLVFQHSHSSFRLAIRKRSRPARSSLTETSRNRPPARASSAARDARRESSSSTRRPPGSSTSGAPRMIL